MNLQVKRVQQEILDAVDQGFPVNFSRFRHRWIVDALHHLVFHHRTASSNNTCVRVAFSDGTETRPFPIGCLTPSPPPDKTRPVLRLGLNSGRHPEMDRFVDIYLFRNAETNGFNTSAEQEQYAFHQGKAFLENPGFRAGGLVELHQTGLEPLILGFYRALITVSRNRIKQKQPPIIVQPRSWSPAVIYLKAFLRYRLPKGIPPESFEQHFQNLGAALGQAIQEFDGVFTLMKRADDLLLKWLPERPMWLSEQDILFSRYSRMKSIWKTIYESSQFMTHSHWGYRI